MGWDGMAISTGQARRLNSWATWRQYIYSSEPFSRIPLFLSSKSLSSHFKIKPSFLVFSTVHTLNGYRRTIPLLSFFIPGLVFNLQQPCNSSSSPLRLCWLLHLQHLQQFQPVLAVSPFIPSQAFVIHGFCPSILFYFILYAFYFELPNVKTIQLIR